MSRDFVYIPQPLRSIWLWLNPAGGTFFQVVFFDNVLKIWDGVTVRLMVVLFGILHKEKMHGKYTRLPVA